MAQIVLHRSALKHNFEFLNQKFTKSNKFWGVVSKLLCGNETFLKELVALNPPEIHDSRLSNLEIVKKLSPSIQRVYIKPVPLHSIKRLVQAADVSFNTHITTIKAINEEAKRQNKVHKIIIMIELGDLREGVMGEDLIGFYEQVFNLDHIEVVGLGANLNCLNGILPSKDKLIQLSLYRELINAKFNSSIKWVSAGASITIPLMSLKQVPKGCNHFRVGETLFFGNDIYNLKPAKGMKQNIFTFNATIIEIRNKPMYATGDQGLNMAGEQPLIDDALAGKESIRAIVDVGLLDVDSKYLTTKDSNIEIIGASSDMLVLDLKDNPRNLKLGDKISFIPNYNAVLSLMNSNYIEKVVVD